MAQKTIAIKEHSLPYYPSETEIMRGKVKNLVVDQRNPRQKLPHEPQEFLQSLAYVSLTGGR
jgi:hypothetical protein